MDNTFFDFDQAAIPPLDLETDLSSLNGDINQLEANECFDSLFLDKSASLSPAAPREPETFILKLINDREVEAVRWEYNPGAEYPMFKAKTPCSLCARMACISLYRECSFTHPEMPRGLIETFPGIAEDEQVCHGRTTQKKAAMNSFSAADARGRKSGARFHRDAVKILKTWLSEHGDHPYPNERERDELKELTGLKRSQINNWLANARRRGKVRPASGPASPILGAVDIPTQTSLQNGYENLGPMDRWKCSPPEHEPASMTAIARAVTSHELPAVSNRNSVSSLHNSRPSSRPSSRKASSEDDSTNLSIMFQPPSVSSFETRDSTNSSFSLASSRSHRSKQSFASSQERRRRRRAPLLHHRNDSTSKMGPPAANPKLAKQKPTQNGKDRIFQCTFCTENFTSKYDWQRHEKALHLALERWTCCPMGSIRIDPTTGLEQCVFCSELSPTAAHLENHNFQACHEKTMAERTFYRKDHLRQHLRLMHRVKYDPHMDTWKSTTFEIKSRCGFCPSLFTTWQARADHIAAHYRNGCDMKDWKGGWGFENYVERLVENAIPPYLIGHERNTMNPYRARAAPSKSAKSTPPSLSCTVTCDMTEDSGTERVEVDQRTKDSNCWLRLEDELIRYVMDQRANGKMPDDRTIQDHARTFIYGDADPWDWTMADNQIWLDAFKCENGILPSSPQDVSSPEYQNTRSVPVAAPYVIKGGLRTAAKRIPTQNNRHVPNLSGVQERSCPLADARSCPASHPSTNSSYNGGTPITPVEDFFGTSANKVELDFGIPTTHHNGPIDASRMDLDFDAIDFNQLDLNAFGEMDFEAESLSHAGSLPATSAIAYASHNALADLGTCMPLSSGIGQQKPLPAPIDPFMEVEDLPEMDLEAFDRLHGYRESFR